MLRAFRLVAVLLATVMLSTVLSPHFGWEAVAADYHHGAEAVADPSHGHGADHHDADHHDGHTCGAHMYNHLQTQACAPLSAAVCPHFAPRMARAAPALREAPGERLFHPPRSAS